MPATTSSQSPPQAMQRSASPPARSPSNAGPLGTLFAGLIATPFIVYYYYQHRKEHMEQKKELLLQEARERYQAGGSN